MKTTLCILLWLFSSLLFTTSISAHSNGLPYIKINGQFVHSNLFINSKINPKFLLGTDVAPLSKYVINEPLTISIDNTVLRNPYHTHSIYQWDFGDSTELSYGEQVGHTYTKSGTYFITLKVENEANGPFMFLETVQITIAPLAQYQLPKAKITVNNKLITDPKNTTIPILLGKPITFDARASTGSIISYQWDFVDGSGSDKDVAVHTYKKGEFTTYFAQLRVTDNHGIVNDEMVLLDSAPLPRQSLWSQFHVFIASLLNRLTHFFLR